MSTSSNNLGATRSKVSRFRESGHEVVLGAGGIKGFGHLGFLRAIEERDVEVGKLTGVSAGSLVAALYTNGISTAEMAEIYLSERMHSALTAAVNHPMRMLNPLRYVMGLVDIRSPLEEIVRKYNLRPNHNLRIVAYNVWRREPVVFEGTKYDLATALAASCAVPGVMRPVWYSPECGSYPKFVTKLAARTMPHKGFLVDGGVHHMNPAHLCKGPAIVSSLGMASKMPSEFLGVVDWAFHMAEYMCSSFFNGLFNVTPEHVVIPVGMPDIGGLCFGITNKKCEEMIEYGCRVTHRYLDEAFMRGRVKAAV